MGSNSYREFGGGSATGLGNDLVNFLQQGLNTGTFGAGFPAGGGAMGQTAGIAGMLNDILAGGAGVLGGNMINMVNQGVDNQAAELRARFGAGGGMGMGTGAQYAEAQLRSQAAPQILAGIGNMQMQALMPILQMMTQLGGKGISQRQGVMQPNGLVSGIGSIAPMIGMLGAGPLGGAIGGMFGGGSPPMPNPMTMAPINFNPQLPVPALPFQF